MKKFLALLAVLALVFQPSLLLAEEKKPADKPKPVAAAGTEEKDLEALEEDEDFELDEEEEEEEAGTVKKPDAAAKEKKVV